MVEDSSLIESVALNTNSLFKDCLVMIMMATLRILKNSAIYQKCATWEYGSTVMVTQNMSFFRVHSVPMAPVAAEVMSQPSRNFKLN